MNSADVHINNVNTSTCHNTINILIYQTFITSRFYTIFNIYVDSVKQTRKTMRDQGDSLELLSLSLVLDVRHSEKDKRISCRSSQKHSTSNINYLLMGENYFHLLKRPNGKKGPCISTSRPLKKGIKKAEVLLGASAMLSKY